MSEAAPRRVLPSLVGLAIALVLPALLVIVPAGDLGAKIGETTAILLNEAVVWAMALAVLGIVVFWERRPLASIGLVRPTWRAIGLGGLLVFGLIALAALAAAAVLGSGVSIPTEPSEMVLGLPIAVQLIAAVSAGFTEEILFRGYAIERVTELTRSRWLGAILPILVFGAVHAPFWGVGHALVAGLSGLWLTLIYLWRRNLWTNITTHALLDVIGLVGADILQQYGVGG